MDAELLRGLVAAVKESREALQAFANDGMPPNYFRHMEAEAALDDALEAAELSVAQGQGFVMVPREPTTEILIALAEASLGILTESVTLVEGYSNILAAAPAQPDGVE